MKKIILLVFTVVITSCNTHKATLKELKHANVNYQMSYDAMRRGSIVSFDSNGKMRILSEVQPDAAVTQTTDLTAKLSAKLKTGDSISAEQITKITESLSVLGERTAAVNMLRDALYRLEEHCINFPDKCSEEKYWQRYDTVIKAVTQLQKDISTQKTQDAEKAKPEKEKIEYLSKLSPEEKEKFNLNK